VSRNRPDDGAKRRIVQKTYTGGSLGETRQLYYTEPSKWQVLEERLGTSPDSAAAERQFVWGLRYIDDLVLRDRDTDNNGNLDERLYACQDANWNVTALINASGTVQERYAYTAYGMPTYLTAAFGGRTTSSHAWESLYCGYRYEAATGLFHVRHRVLHLVIGTWVQRDPMRYVDGLSLYSFCKVLVDTDPFGMQIGRGGIGPSMPYHQPAPLSYAPSTQPAYPWDPTGHPWSDSQLPHGVYGFTRPHFTIYCNCECDRGSQAWRMRCETSLTHTIHIDVGQIEAVAAATLSGVYGHEQRHVFMSMLVFHILSDMLHSGPALGTYTSRQECDRVRRFQTDTFFDIWRSHLESHPRWLFPRGRFTSTEYEPFGQVPNAE
jgi:RHS repeat-associated protein